MRIVSGDLRGSTLYITKDKTTRPLKDMVRESIFNLLIHSNKISFQRVFKIVYFILIKLFCGYFK